MLNIPGDYASMLRNQRPNFMSTAPGHMMMPPDMEAEMEGEPTQVAPDPMPPPVLPERSVLVRPEMAMMDQPASTNMTPAQRIRSMLAMREARVR